MKMPVRILLAVLCAALIVALPFVVSSPNMLYEVKTELMNEEEDYDDEIDFGRLFLSAAYAEDADVDFEEEDLDAEENGSKSSGNTLPIDFSPAPAPKAELYTEDGYEDESITVKMEHREFDELTMIHIAYIQIADASQLRTGVYKPEKLASSKGYPVQVIARKYNPVIAINGDNYTNDPKKTTFEYRMGQMIRSKGNRKKDVLIIDDQGDFHLYIQSQGLEKGKTKDGKVSWKNAEDWEAETGLKLVNACCPEDRSAYSATGTQATVCGIHNGICFQLCDIVLVYFYCPCHSRGGVYLCFIHGKQSPLYVLYRLKMINQIIISF